MTYIEAIRNVLLDTKSTVSELSICLSKLETKEEQQFVLKELTKDFDTLYDTYIRPKIEVKEGKFSVSFNPHYQEHEDDLFLSEEALKNQIAYEREATSNWLERKEDELKAIYLKNYTSKTLKSKKDIRYKTLSSPLKLTPNDRKDLLKALKDCTLIVKSTKLSQLENALSNESKVKPRIIIRDSQRQLLAFLLIKLKLNRGKYNENIYASEIFINEDNTPIKDIRKQVSLYGKRTDNKLCENPNIEKLYKELIYIFEKQNLGKLPLKKKSKERQ